MRIQLLSDLHLETDFNMSVNDKSFYFDSVSDVVILAGDIHNGIKGVEWAKNNANHYKKHFIYVAGNHEFWNNKFPDLYSDLKQYNSTYFHFLEQEEFVYNDVVFLGCTLWTDFNIFKNQKEAIEKLDFRLDYKKIQNNKNIFITPEDTIKWNKNSIDWIKHKIDYYKNKKIVIITHHAPSLKCSHPDFIDSLSSVAFLNDFDDMIKKSNIHTWIYGHTHNKKDFFINNTRILNNPRGYKGEFCEMIFHPKLEIEI